MFLTHLTDAITTFITNLYATTGLAGIVLAMAIESCCIPLPSEIVMPLAGVMVVSGTILAGVNPVLAILLVALAGAIGCLVGSIAAYGIGYAGGRPLMLKYGRYVLISQHDADKADAFFQRWGSETTFFSRLLPVVRTYISLPAGIAKMPFGRFCLYTFLGSFPWCLLRALHAAEAAAAASMAQQQPFMQNGWERQPQQPQQPQQQLGQSQQWGQQPPQSPQQPQQQQGWGQQPPQQSPQQQQWGRVQSPQQQPPQQPSWPSQNGTNGWDGQRR